MKHATNIPCQHRITDYYKSSSRFEQWVNSSNARLGSIGACFVPLTTNSSSPVRYQPLYKLHFRCFHISCLNLNRAVLYIIVHLLFIRQRQKKFCIRENIFSRFLFNFVCARMALTHHNLKVLRDYTTSICKTCSSRLKSRTYGMSLIFQRQLNDNILVQKYIHVWIWIVFVSSEQL